MQLKPKNLSPTPQKCCINIECLPVTLETFFCFLKKMWDFYIMTLRQYNNYSMSLPSLPNNSTPNAANMKNNRKNRSPKFPTWGNACITVSKRALIPFAIFSNFKTEKNAKTIIIVLYFNNIIVIIVNTYII